MLKVSNMTEEKALVHISRKLYDKIKAKVKLSRGDFKSVEEYIEFVLSEVINEEVKQVYTPREEEEIKKRLRKLGYL